jgi:hypothetical protein
MSNNFKNYLAKEYFSLFLGVFLSFIFNFLFDYLFSISNLSTDHYYKWSWNSWLITVAYFVMTGYFLSLMIPILSLREKKYYKNFLILLSFSNIIWIFLLTDKSLNNVFGVFQIAIICLPMPLSCLFAWQINKRYWKIKEACAP